MRPRDMGRLGDGLWGVVEYVGYISLVQKKNLGHVSQSWDTKPSRVAPTPSYFNQYVR